MTKQCDVAVDDERFILKNQGAQDIKKMCIRDRLGTEKKYPGSTFLIQLPIGE